MINPFLQEHDAPLPQSSKIYLDEDDFSTLYSAADFAHAFGLYFDTTISISWSLMGEEVATNVQKYFNRFQKCLRDWLGQRNLPSAWIYAHEHGRRVGLHTHMALSIPGDIDWFPATHREEFRKWIGGWVERQIGRKAPNSLRVRVRRKETPELHWVTTSYLMKTFDPSIIVQSARSSPDGWPVYLGDLIRTPHHPSGPVEMKQRVGSSRSLSRHYRDIGVPAGLERYYPQDYSVVPYALVPRLGMTKVDIVNKPVTKPFRSKYEDGIRDVRKLYPEDFYKRGTGLPSTPPTVTSGPDCDSCTYKLLATLSI